MDDSQELLQFPCEFPIKVIGKTSLAFEGEVVALFRRHFPQLGEGAVTVKFSQSGNYQSLTVTFIAQSRLQLDTIYRELTSLPAVLMVL